MVPSGNLIKIAILNVLELSDAVGCVGYVGCTATARYEPGLPGTSDTSTRASLSGNLAFMTWGADGLTST